MQLKGKLKMKEVVEEQHEELKKEHDLLKKRFLESEKKRKMQKGQLKELQA